MLLKIYFKTPKSVFSHLNCRKDIIHRQLRNNACDLNEDLLKDLIKRQYFLQ